MYPLGMTKLTPWPWQLRDVETLRRNNFTGLLAIEPGGTKTLIATLAIKEARPRVTLIVAPKSTHRTAWIPTLRDNAGVEARVIGNDNKATKAAMFDFEIGMAGTYLITPQLLTRSDVSAWRGDMMILDESHQVSTAKSAAQRKVSGYSAQDGEPLSYRFTHRLALSGTPMRQAFQNLWATCKFLWPQYYQRGMIAHDNFTQWEFDRMEYRTVYTNQRDRDGNPKTVKQFLGEKEPGRLVSEMPCVIMHKRRETCCADPSHQGGFLKVGEPQVIRREVELTKKQTTAIKEMESMMMTWIDDNPLVADISLTMKQRVRQLTLGEALVENWIDVKDGEEIEKSRIQFDPECKSPAIDEALHILDNLGSEPVVLFLESQKFAEVVTYRLNKAGIASQEYSGVRKADLSRFGQDYRVLVGVVSALGTGTDGLQHVCNTEIWMEQPISLTMQSQAFARLERTGGRQVQRYLLMDDYGVQDGRFEDLALTKLAVNQSLRKVA